MKYTKALKWIDERCKVEADYPERRRIADLQNYKDYLNIYIGDLIAENRDNRFKVIYETEEVKIWMDTCTERFFGLEKGYNSENEKPTRKWHELFISLIMGKEDFYNHENVSEEEMDYVYDAISYCPYSFTITRNGIEYILWLDYYRSAILSVPEIEHEDGGRDDGEHEDGEYDDLTL